MSEDTINIVATAIVMPIVTILVDRLFTPLVKQWWNRNSHERKIRDELITKGYVEVIARIDKERAEDKAECEAEIAELKAQHREDRKEIHAVRNEHQNCQNQLNRLGWQNEAQQREINQLQTKVKDLEARPR